MTIAVLAGISLKHATMYRRSGQLSRMANCVHLSLGVNLSCMAGTSGARSARLASN